MLCRLFCVVLFVGLAEGAFDAAPIRWQGISAQRFVLASSQMAPQKLTVGALPSKMSDDVVPHFMPKSDSTIAWDAKGLCLEASGVEVRVNQCSGGPTQRWNWLPWGPIQLKGTNQCLDASDGGPLELRECGNKMSELWTFEDDRIPRLTQQPPQQETFSSAIRQVTLALLSFLSIGSLGVGAWLWRWGKEANLVAGSQGGVRMAMDQGGVVLIQPMAAHDQNDQSAASLELKEHKTVSTVRQAPVLMIHGNDTADVFDPLGLSADARQMTVTHGRVAFLTAALGRGAFVRMQAPDATEDDVPEVTEEEWLAQQKQDEPELSDEARKLMRGMRSAKGVELAPWMKVDAEAIIKAKKEREVRLAKRAQEQNTMDSPLLDPQAAEISGVGSLNSKVLSEDTVELTWATEMEKNNVGFVIQRRKGRTNDWETIATFRDYPALRSKGSQGGVYVHVDDGVAPGIWVYRIGEENAKGERVGISQKLVEVESEAENKQLLAVGSALFGVFVVCFIAGLVLDPTMTTEGGVLF